MPVTNKTTHVVVCHTHDLSWDMDYDPPQCSCDYEDLDLLVFEDDDDIEG